MGRKSYHEKQELKMIRGAVVGNSFHDRRLYFYLWHMCYVIYSRSMHP